MLHGIDISAPVEERRYRALRFLPMEVGDLIKYVLCSTELTSSVLYEVGRIDELEGFPFPTIGVEDDGLLVRLIDHPPLTPGWFSRRWINWSRHLQFPRASPRLKECMQCCLL